MDPVSRRFVWKHISDIKTGRVILLTTHAMEEADLLSDHVAIMSQGKLAAFGSPLELKTKHGSALQFSLISEKEDVKVVEEAGEYNRNPKALMVIDYFLPVPPSPDGLRFHEVFCV